MDQRGIFPRSLQYLIAIAEHGSYTRAAKALHVSQPTLSQQIKHLEELLQTPLLDRTGRTVRLTDAGEAYLHYARCARRDLEAGTRAIQDVQNLSRGSLRLGWTPITDCLACPLLEDFNTSYPNISLSTLEMPQDDIEIAVAEDHVDIGIVFSKPFSAKTRSLEVQTDMLFEEMLHIAVGNAHPLAKYQNKQMSVQEFEQESLALLNTDFALRRHIDQYCLDQGIVPHITVETNSLSVIIEMVRLGTLATVLPNSINQMKCQLHSIELTPEMPCKAITLVYRKGGYRSPACLAFSRLASNWSTHKLQQALVRRRKPCSLLEDQKLGATGLEKVI